MNEHVRQPAAMPQEFVDAFIAYANERNEWDDDPLDLQFRPDDQILLLSNDCPGFCPFLRIATDDGATLVEVVGRSSTYLARGSSSTANTEYAEHVGASTVVDLNDPKSAARAAWDCWATTL